MQAIKKKNVLRKVEGVTPAAWKQFRLEWRMEMKSLQEAEEELALKGLGKLLVSRPQQLLDIQLGSRCLAGASNRPSSLGPGRGRGKKEVREQ